MIQGKFRDADTNKEQYVGKEVRYSFLSMVQQYQQFRRIIKKIINVFAFQDTTFP